MVDLVLTQGENVVTVPGNIVYGTEWYDKRLNQYAMETADGGDIVYDGGPTLVYGVILMKNVSYTDGELLRSWIRTYAIFQKNTFTISAITGLDLGNGKGVAITGARYNGSNDMKGVLAYEAPGIYSVNFPYKYKRS